MATARCTCVRVAGAIGARVLAHTALGGARAGARGQGREGRGERAGARGHHAGRTEGEVGGDEEEVGLGRVKSAVRGPEQPAARTHGRRRAHGARRTAHGARTSETSARGVWATDAVTRSAGDIRHRRGPARHHATLPCPPLPPPRPTPCLRVRACGHGGARLPVHLGIERVEVGLVPSAGAPEVRGQPDLRARRAPPTQPRAPHRQRRGRLSQ